MKLRSEQITNKMSISCGKKQQKSYGKKFDGKKNESFILCTLKVTAVTALHTPEVALINLLYMTDALLGFIGSWIRHQRR